LCLFLRGGFFRPVEHLSIFSSLSLFSTLIIFFLFFLWLFLSSSFFRCTFFHDMGDRDQKS
jgi:hypothetical protein